MSGAISQPCPYEVLGLDTNATEAEIKAQFRRMSLRYHPDKQHGNSEQDATAAGERFKAVAIAYGILSDPEKRRKFDVNGHNGCDDDDEQQDDDVELDLSQLNLFDTAVAAAYSKMGVGIKTTVPPALLEKVEAGNFKWTTLNFGVPVTGKVDRAAANFYRLTVSQTQIEAGFVVSAYGTPGSRFKLLLFEEEPSPATADGGGCGTGYGANDTAAATSGSGISTWQLALQEDARQVGRRHCAAGLYLLRFDTYSLPPSAAAAAAAAAAASPSAAGLGGVEFDGLASGGSVGGGMGPGEGLFDEAETSLFGRLRRLRRRDSIGLRPGTYVVAVYGDNWLKNSRYTIQALLPGSDEDAARQLQEVETKLLQKRRAVDAFEQRFRRTQVQLSHSPLGLGLDSVDWSARGGLAGGMGAASMSNQLREQFVALCGQFEREREQVVWLLAEREAAYCRILRLPQNSSSSSGGGDGGNGGAHSRGDSVPELSPPVMPRPGLFSCGAPDLSHHKQQHTGIRAHYRRGHGGDSGSSTPRTADAACAVVGSGSGGGFKSGLGECVGFGMGDGGGDGVSVYSNAHPEPHPTPLRQLRRGMTAPLRSLKKKFSAAVDGRAS